MSRLSTKFHSLWPQGQLVLTLQKKRSFWPVLNVACKLSVSWSIFCLFCYRHNLWYNPESQRTFCFSFYLLISVLLFLLKKKQYWIVCIPIMMVYSFFFPRFLDSFTSICTERSMLTWYFKNKEDKCLCSSTYRKLCLFSSSCCHLTIQSNQEYITSTLEEIKSMELNC